MIGKPPRSEFGKRRPSVPTVTQPASKRSSHVALLVMGTLAVGGGAYALMPGERCVPPPPAAPGMAAPAIQPSAPCTSRGSSFGGSGGGRSSSFSFYSGDSSSGTSAASASESSSRVTRGGFGSFARAFGFGGG